MTGRFPMGTRSGRRESNPTRFRAVHACSSLWMGVWSQFGHTSGFWRSIGTDESGSTQVFGETTSARTAIRNLRLP